MTATISARHVNRTARLMAAAHGGQVVVSHATEDLVARRDARGCSAGGSRRASPARPVSCRATFPGPDARAQRSRSRRLRSLDAFPGNLPVQLTSFVGRDDDVAGVAKALDRVAAGDVDRASVAWARRASRSRSPRKLLPRFADGVWLCELAATNDADLLAQVVVAALGGATARGAVAGRERVRLPLGQAGVDRARQLRASPRRGGRAGRGDAACRAGGAGVGDEPGAARRGRGAAAGGAVTACRVRSRAWRRSRRVRRCGCSWIARRRPGRALQLDATNATADRGDLSTARRASRWRSSSRRHGSPA